MVGRLEKVELLARGEVVRAPAAVWQDYSFELPPVLHFAMAALFLGFVSVLCAAFALPGMAVPLGVFVAFIVAFFAVPGIFVRSAPEGSANARKWDEFMVRGIAIEHGRCSGREAAVLVMMLPVFILGWAIAVATIAAFV